MSLRDTLEKLREEYTSEEDREQIAEWEKQVKMNDEFVKLKDNVAIKTLLDEMEESIKIIDSRLVSDRSLLNDEGKLLVDKKAVYRNMLSKFDEASDNNKSIEEEIKNKL